MMYGVGKKMMSFLERIENWIAAVVVGLVGWVWSSVTRRIRDLEKETIKREEFNQYTGRIDKRFDEMRESTIKLFDRIDDLKTTVLDRNRQ